MRESWRLAALNDIVRWIQDDDGAIAIYDATNVERQSRLNLDAFCTEHGFKFFTGFKKLIKVFLKYF